LHARIRQALRQAVPVVSFYPAKAGLLAMKPMTDKHFATLRRHMVEVIAIHTELMEEELGKAALNQPVLTAMLQVPRHLFVPEQLASIAYDDRPLPIGFQKTISQPLMCALMTDLLALEAHDVVLEVGTGLGYQTAILAELATRIWSVEIVEELAESARARLADLDYSNVEIRVGDGSRGWQEHAPYDKIIVAAAHEEVPRSLLEQLRPGGRLVMPLGPDDAQELTLVSKDAAGNLHQQEIMPVRFTRLETVL
jgi:protein-L-isoaspartate(D-aspartate) O-methyltransferase